MFLSCHKEREENAKIKEEFTSNRSKLDNEWKMKNSHKRLKDGWENTKMVKDALSVSENIH